MKIVWYGTASVSIESSRGTKLLFDPFLRMNKKLPEIPLSAYMGYDAILLTHGHLDHIYHVPKVAKADKNASIYCTKAPKKSLMKMGVEEERVRLISPEEEFVIGDIKIRAKQGRHVRFDLPYIAASTPGSIIRPFKAVWMISSGITLPEKGEILIYEVRCDGKLLTVMGSFGIDKNTEYTKEPDLLVFPYNGSTKIPSLAVKPLTDIKPKSVFFDHYDNAFPPLTRRMDVEGYEKRVNREFPDIRTVIPREREIYEI